MPCYLKPNSLPSKPGDFFSADCEQSRTASAWLIDPGLRHYRGHHYTLDTVLRNALGRIFHIAELLCHRDLPIEPGFTPCFSTSTYFSAQTASEVDEVCEERGKAISDDLRNTLSGRIQQRDSLLMPAASIVLLIGVRRWLEGLPDQCRPTGLQVHFFTLPTHEVYGDAAQARVTQRFIEEALYLEQHFNVRWSADHASLADWYSTLCGWKFICVKSPHLLPEGKTKVQRHDGRVRLLFIGEIRQEKGFSHILQALPAIFRETRFCDFRFVVPGLGDEVRAYLSSQPVGRISMRIMDNLPYEDYCDEITNADHVLCAYAPEHYQFKTSGIVVEAALMNVPIVITRGMAAERDLEDFEKVTVLPDNYPESLETFCIALDKRQADKQEGTAIKLHSPPVNKMRAIYINLEDQQERRQFVEHNFVSHAYSSWTLHRIAAVGPEYIRENNIRGQLRDSEKACFVSHMLAIERSLQYDGHIMVLEDDVLFGPSSCRLIENSLQRLSDKPWDILYADIGVSRPDSMLELFCSRINLVAQSDFALLNLPQLHFGGATAYIINAHAKDKVLGMLRAITQIDRPYDLALRDMINKGQLEGFAIYPFATSLSRFADNSQIQPAADQIFDAALNAFRRLVWVDAERSSVDPLESIKRIPSSFYDPSSQDFIKILGVRLSANFKVK